MANVIKFDCNYPKLCNQAEAKLVYVEIIEDCAFTLNAPAIEALLEYDTKRPDGTTKEIPEGNYFLLLFVGDKGIMFSTLRKHNPTNRRKYLNKIGQWFYVEVKGE